MKYPGVYRGIVLSADPVSLRVKCTVPSVTLQQVVEAEACIPPGWHDQLRDLLQDHPDHMASDPQGGTDAINPNHGSAHPHRLTTTTPRPGIEGVWVMYEAGEVEHPVWVGCYKIGAN